MRFSRFFVQDKVTNQHQGFGFVEFAGELDADYACKVMGGVKLFGKPIRCNKASPQKRGIVTYDVGANLFIGNLSPEVDERLLYDTFSRFGVIVATPKIMREESNESKGYAFISFGDFESSDGAIAALNGQYLAGRPISVAYAIKKDSKGERHGSEAERMLAHQKRIAQGVPQQVQRPQAAMAPVSVRNCLDVEVSMTFFCFLVSSTNVCSSSSSSVPETSSGSSSSFSWSATIHETSTTICSSSSNAISSSSKLSYLSSANSLKSSMAKTTIKLELTFCFVLLLFIYTYHF